MKRYAMALVFASALVLGAPVLADILPPPISVAHAEESAVPVVAATPVLPVVVVPGTAVDDAPPIPSVDLGATEAVSAAPGTGALTATGTPAPGELPGVDLTVGEGIALGKLMIDAFKGGMWQIGIALLWFLLLAVLRRLYMPFLKERMSKNARRILIGGLTWGTCTAGGVLGGVGIWASLFGGFMLAGGVMFLWSIVGSIPFVKKLTGKAAEEENAKAGG